MSSIVFWSNLSTATSSQCRYFVLNFLLFSACQLHLKNSVTMFFSGICLLYLLRPNQKKKIAMNMRTAGRPNAKEKQESSPMHSTRLRYGVAIVETMLPKFIEA